MREHRWPFAPTFAIAALFLGILLRLYLLVRNDSLFVDDALVAVNLQAVGWSGLLHGPLPYFDQAAPPGFLLVSKLASSLWPGSTGALRLFPALCGFGACLLALWFYRDLAEEWLDDPGRRSFFVGSALVLVACSYFGIRYSVAIKQYAPELLVAFAYLLATERHARGRLGRLPLLLIGGLSTLLSSSFVLLALACLGARLLRAMAHRRTLAGLALVQGMFFAAVYALYMKDAYRFQLANYPEVYGPGYLPRHPVGFALQAGRFLLSELNYYLHRFGTDGRFLCSYNGLLIVVTVIGAIAAFRNPHALTFNLTLGLLVLACLALSEFRLFPLIAGRYASCFFPWIGAYLAYGLLVTAEGAAALLRRQVLAPSIAVSLGALLLVPYAYVGIMHAVVRPDYVEDTRTALREALETPDVVYLSAGAQPAFRYYYGDRIPRKPILGAVDPRSATRFDPQVVQDFGSIKDRPGAWGTVTGLYATDRVAYEQWLLVQVTRDRRPLTVVVAHSLGRGPELLARGFADRIVATRHFAGDVTLFRLRAR